MKVSMFNSKCFLLEREQKKDTEKNTSLDRKKNPKNKAVI